MVRNNTVMPLLKAMSIVFVFSMFVLSSTNKVYAVRAECGTDQCPISGSEFCCGADNDMKCTGGGCPSWVCDGIGGGSYNALSCGGEWTCCVEGYDCTWCTSRDIYLSWGSCEYCPTYRPPPDPDECDNVPTAITLSAPANGSTFQDATSITFNWTKPNGWGNEFCTSKQFRFQIDNENTFSNPKTYAISYADLNKVSTTIPATALPSEGTFYWRVGACNSEGCSWATNGPRTFILACGTAPGAAHTPTPASGSTDVPLPLTIRWQPPVSWGTACGIPNNNRYTVYAKVKSGASCDAPNPAAYTAIPGCINFLATRTSCNMSGFVINNTSYCWFVKTSNGTESTLSAANAAGVWWFKTEDPLLYQNWVTALYGDFYTGSLSEEYPSLATHIAPWNPPYAVYEGPGSTLTSFISNSSTSITTDNTTPGYSPLSQSNFWVLGANFKNIWPASYKGTPPADATSLPLGGGSDCTKVFTAAPKLDPSKVYKGTAGCISQAVNNSNGNYQLSGSKGYVVVYVTGGGSLNINKPFITDNDDFRVIFVTGEGVSVKVSNNSDMKIATPNLSSQPLVEAAFVVSKSIEFTGSADPKTSPDESIVVEGPIIAKSVQFDRNRGSSNMYPSEIVKYNSNYIYNLTDKERTSAKSNISGLFVIDVDWLEGE